MTLCYLIIDDDEHFGQVLKRSLERAGHTCHHISHPESLASITDTPDRIVLDLRLADSSGLDLIATLKQHWPDSSIVMLTGYASIPTAVEAVKAGADNYLHKPATLTDLQRAFEDSSVDQTTGSVMSVDRMEWEHIQRVLNEHDGNISATARALNMHRRTLQRKLQKYAPR
ncbi:MAG: two-component system response regulator [Thalassolituus sp.]|jgi:two-component system response regulator RegA|uniref:response regulator transcription factor n=1 Tax=Thalassolituus sp. TaxID=2030822 RepID=UPI00261CCA56|nr:response regulator [uncultured Thalassolituus sp.]TNC92535.1 MAG: two-component system response regulator [Thalassolituus sp.]